MRVVPRLQTFVRRDLPKAVSKLRRSTDLTPRSTPFPEVALGS